MASRPPTSIPLPHRGIGVELGEAAAPFRERGRFDRQGEVGETSTSLYLISLFVNLDAVVPAKLTMPDHLEAMVPAIEAGDPAALRDFLAERAQGEGDGQAHERAGDVDDGSLERARSRGGDARAGEVRDRGFRPGRGEVHPYACRKYDCRIQIFVRALDLDTNGELTPISRAASEKFRIVCKEPDDEWLLTACRLAFIRAFAKTGNMSVSRRIALAPDLLELFEKPDPLTTDPAKIDHAIDTFLKRTEPDGTGGA